MHTRRNRPPQTTRINVDVSNNTIICGANGGNVSGYSEDEIVWFSTDRRNAWTLQFVPLGLENEGAPLQELSTWPFIEPEPPGGLVAATTEFRGKLREFRQDAAPFKYTLTIGNLRLDPIVIVVSKP
jgi:hypothetical protein